MTTYQIIKLKAEREALIVSLKAAYKAREIAYQPYAQAHNTWVKLAKEFEALDREIALHENAQKPAKTTTSRPHKTDKERSTDAARKALEALPADIREQLLKTFAK